MLERAERAASHDPVRTGGVLLAAGRSARMGQAKQLLVVGGRPLLQHAIDAACASRLREVVLVLGYRAEDIAAAMDFGRARVERCADWSDGPGASLACGLNALGEDVEAAAVLLGDQPAVGAALIDRVLAAWRETAEPALRPRFEEESGASVPGHPVLLAREVWAEVVASGGGNDTGARVWLGANADRVRELSVGEPAPSDVDTWQDYRRVATESRTTEA